MTFTAQEFKKLCRCGYSLKHHYPQDKCKDCSCKSFIFAQEQE